MRYLSIVFISLFLFAGCTKFAEGPKITLRTNKARLCKNTWKLASVHDITNDKEVSASEAGWSDENYIDFNKEEQSYSSKGLHDQGLVLFLFVNKGLWEIIDKKDLILFGNTGDGTVGIVKYEIIRLTVKNLWLKTYPDDFGVSYEVKFSSIDKI